MHNYTDLKSSQPFWKVLNNEGSISIPLPYCNLPLRRVAHQDDRGFSESRKWNDIIFWHDRDRLYVLKQAWNGQIRCIRTSVHVFSHFFNNNTGTEHTSFDTYLCLLFHVIAINIKALVIPWYQFVYTLVTPCGRRQHSTGHNHLRRVYQFDGAGLYGGCSKMCQWNCSRSKACVCRAVCEHTLSCNKTIPRESLPLRQDNLRSHRPAENEKHLAPHSRLDSQSAQP